MVQSQPGEIVRKTLSWKNPSQKRAGGMAQGVGPEFKPQYCKKKKKDWVIWLEFYMYLKTYYKRLFKFLTFIKYWLK
jgi:hypothetical protein